MKLSDAPAACNKIDVSILLTDYNEVCTFQNRIAFVYLNFYNLTVAVSRDVVLHLHGFQHEKLLASLHNVANLAVNTP